MFMFVFFGFVWFVAIFVAAWYFYWNRTAEAVIASMVMLLAGLISWTFYVPIPQSPSAGAVVGDLITRYEIEDVDVDAFMADRDERVSFTFDGQTCHAQVGVADVDADVGWVPPTEELPVPPEGVETRERFFIMEGTTVCEVAVPGPENPTSPFTPNSPSSTVDLELAEP